MAAEPNAAELARRKRGQELLNGKRGQNTAHRLQHIYRALDQGAVYPFSPTSMQPRPFPALTPGQRLHLEVHGYVVVESVFSADECEEMKRDLYAIEEAFKATGDLPNGMDPNQFSWFTATEEDFFRVDNIPHLCESFYKYVTHPRLLAMMEEITGVEVRLEQSDAHIRRPTHGGKPTKGRHRYGLHGGQRGYMGRAFEHTDKGLFHYSFVKTLTNLTDLGPDDGGTVVIAGSHKIDSTVDPSEIIEAAMENPSLIHHVVAPAGSVLVFYEATMHASGIIDSDKDRLLMISGYTPANMGTWMGYQPDPIFLRHCPAEVP
jgi:hypothetical protein